MGVSQKKKNEGCRKRVENEGYHFRNVFDIPHFFFRVICFSCRDISTRKTNGTKNKRHEKQTTQKTMRDVENDTICVVSSKKETTFLKLQVSFAEYRLFYRALLQKRPIILRSLLTEATPYQKRHEKQ